MTAPIPPSADSVQAFLAQVDARLASQSPSAPAANHWYDSQPSEFTAAQRAHTTILHAGLTMAHDLFIQSAFRGLGYKVQALPVPDTAALQLGREYGNRGQCNPTYFTVGNLIKHLKTLEDSGLSKEDIIQQYVFATAGACGPCRFGTYATEYRKALRDAGFEGFRVIVFQQAGGIKQATGAEKGLKIDARFFITMIQAIVIGDIINALGYRIRPYEIHPGQTDAVIQAAKARIAQAFETRSGLIKALWHSRKAFAAIPVDLSQAKPKVAIIGEFWAMTTEGDGNYHMHRFLESEGAEVDIQLVVNWGLYLLWGAQFDLARRSGLKGTDKGGPEGSKFALENVSVAQKTWMLKGAEAFMRGIFYSYAQLLGLRGYSLPDMNLIANISHAFYNNHLRGGEGHMEVGKLMHNVIAEKAHMTLSLKPFGCMPSSGVSDGVQSLITELFPQALFVPIETNGDGAVNSYSRVQMQLFKAKHMAEQALQQALDAQSLSLQAFKSQLHNTSAMNKGAYSSPFHNASTALNSLHTLQLRQQNPIKRLLQHWQLARQHRRHAHTCLAAAQQAATAFAQRQPSKAIAVVNLPEAATVTGGWVG